MIRQDFPLVQLAVAGSEEVAVDDFMVQNLSIAEARLVDQELEYGQGKQQCFDTYNEKEIHQFFEHYMKPQISL